MAAVAFLWCPQSQSLCVSVNQARLPSHCQGPCPLIGPFNGGVCRMLPPASSRPSMSGYPRLAAHGSPLCHLPCRCAARGFLLHPLGAWYRSRASSLSPWERWLWVLWGHGDSEALVPVPGVLSSPPAQGCVKSLIILGRALPRALHREASVQIMSSFANTAGARERKINSSYHCLPLTSLLFFSLWLIGQREVNMSPLLKVAHLR